MLIIHESNPAYSIPSAMEQIRRAGTVVYLGTMMDETAELADWFLPIDSPLESWGEYEPVRGICSLMQPTMSRLYDTRNAGDILLSVAKSAGRALTWDGNAIPAASFEESLHARWKRLAADHAPDETFEHFWKESVRRGFFEHSQVSAESQVKLASSGVELSPLSQTWPTVSDDTFELWAWPSPLLFDGRVANRGWLQEAPDPLSTIVWGSWIDMNPGRAPRMGISQGDIIELDTAVGKIRAPVRFTDDVHEAVAAIAFGQGHTALGRNAAQRGANAFMLLGATDSAHMFGTAKLHRAGGNTAAIATCATDDQHHREIVQWVDFGIVAAMKPGEGNQLRLPLPEGYDPKHDLYDPHTYPNHRWAMAVDLDRCTGCGACGVACYAENNLPVMGHEQAGRGRIMAWMRVVPYRDDKDTKRAGFIPMMCQQCDAAPCEPVCPVFASVHNDEGLNAQVYNRCIGTRYCSHNCPYKVRRFNWMNTKWEPPLDRQLNPDVSVRCRGVMEKCNFCIQRIREVEQLAKRENRPVRNGEVKPACVQTCPTRALIFGDLMDSKSRVADLTRHDPRRYHVLEELNTKPAVTYLQRVKA
jgi:molybdopterin-containing oxidoreductase family iron-sulfur binding subunit